MDQNAPRALLRILAVIAVVSFGLSMYMEQFQLAWLQQHPITVNLLSSVIGFASGGLVVALFINRIKDRDVARTRHEPMAEDWKVVTRAVREPFGLLTSAELHDVHEARDASAVAADGSLAEEVTDSYARKTASVWGEPSMEPAEWQAYSAAVRAKGLAFLPVARAFAKRYGIAGKKFDTAFSEFEAKLTALPENGDTSGSSQAYSAAGSALQGFIHSVEELHYDITLHQVRAAKKGRAATP
ncbi:hypothetical protein [Nonomuraea endophytica]|uniref:Uncharacterized protein n=1 Tax=Nonomuraea endophytica TaxID=714136 RepID=A0A7W8A232_9ACTN|nr:hypothetical protein [Nonomuraea endophytica]MBB5077013.1 hypothetical protein [Nonomuraea endophytica]